MVVNNNAAAVLLVPRRTRVRVARCSSAAARASRSAAASVCPEVLEQSGACSSTSARRIAPVSPTTGGRSPHGRRRRGRLKVHPSNYRVEGFVESTSVAELATLGVPVIADIGSGLVDANCPWLPGAPPSWLHGEPAARQTIAAGAVARDVQRRQAARWPAGRDHRRRPRTGRRGAWRHPLARALRPGGLAPLGPAGRRAGVPPPAGRRDDPVLGGWSRRRSPSSQRRVRVDLGRLAPARRRPSSSTRSRAPARHPAPPCPRAGVARRRPSRSAACRGSADHRARPRRQDVPRSPHRRPGRTTRTSRRDRRIAR